MASIPRKFILFDNSYFHITWRCHNFRKKSSWILSSNKAKEIYYELLLKYKNKYNIIIYGYSFMNNHVHIVGYSIKSKNISNFFRVVNSIFAKTLNLKLKRTGQVVQDRFKSIIIENISILYKVIQYVHFNPYKARIVKNLRDYKFSSFNFYAFGKNDPLITPYPGYLQLGETKELRQEKFCENSSDYRYIVNCYQQYKTNKFSYFMGQKEWLLNKIEKIKTYYKENYQKQYLVKQIC